MAKTNRVKRHNRIGEGELTGHAHRLTTKTAYVEGTGDVRYMTNPKKTSVVHEEHKEIPLVGDRVIFGQREIDPDTEEIRNVKD